MKIEHFYLKCLAHGSYMITDSGKAAVIDPQRDIQQYIQLAKELNVQITHVINTHHHADFVSGHLELANKTGAKIFLGEKANANFNYTPLKDNDIITLGNINLTILETPGHTPESISIFATDSDNPPALFTGDTLFIGEVGRPDLLEGIMQPKDLASQLYDSLHNKIMTLPDETIIYPAHGAGSQCGKNISDSLNSTLLEQKQTNYALRIPTKEEFIETVLDGMPTPPAYFKYNAKLNKTGPEDLESILKNIKALDVSEFKTIQEDTSIIIIDSRNADDFWNSYIPGSINIPLEGQFASWVGTVIPFASKILVIANEDKIEETITRLSRTGYDSILGYLKSGISEWEKANSPVNKIERTDPSNIDENKILLDVRKPIETNNGKIKDSALTIPLQDFESRISEIPLDKKILIYCGSGYRSSIAMSLLLKKHPNLDITDVRGGYNSWFKTQKLVKA